MAVDVIVIGSGFGGAWAAREPSENGLKVKIFESGPRFNPDTDFKESATRPSARESGCPYASN